MADYRIESQTLDYDLSMAPTKQMTLRLSNIQRSQLKRLAEKLQIDQANVLRLALTRLAEQEGILLTEKRQSN